MRFKLDENLDPRLAPLFAEGGHSVETVLGEGGMRRRGDGAMGRGGERAKGRS
jgi:predicted nuclease of predicted toxin-antitoxin system